MTYEEFRDRLTYHIVKKMKKQRITQTKLAEKAGIAQGTISVLLGGQRDSSLFVLYAVAEALNAEPKDLLGEIGNGKDLYLRKRKKVQSHVVHDGKHKTRKT